ncbi:MAG: hypothetical protein PF541_08695 [Prolixibacteraceae bacterium]|jgi:hypothetical protein|nr:hypothetical protein [Prolixibacteraceae bacterium]
MNKISKENTLSKTIKLCYALVMILAAALIFILFENTIQINSYLIFISLGLIVGLSIVLILHVFMKK